MKKIDPEDQRRIDFAQKLLDGMSMSKKATRFNSPSFLACAVRFGLLKGTASADDAYSVYGELLRLLPHRKRIELGMVAAIESLSVQELRSIRESLAGVIQFKGRAS